MKENSDLQAALAKYQEEDENPGLPGDAEDLDFARERGWLKKDSKKPGAVKAEIAPLVSSSKVESKPISREQLEGFYGQLRPTVEVALQKKGLTMERWPSTYRSDYFDIKRGDEVVGVILLSKKSALQPREDDVALSIGTRDQSRNFTSKSGAMPVTVETLPQVLEWEISNIAGKPKPPPREIGLWMNDVPVAESPAEAVKEKFLEQAERIGKTLEKIRDIAAEDKGSVGQEINAKIKLLEKFDNFDSRLQRFEQQLKGNWPLSLKDSYFSGINQMHVVAERSKQNLESIMKENFKNLAVDIASEVFDLFDNKLDPDRLNQGLQSLVTELLNASELKQILPSKDSQFALVEHSMAKMVARSPESKSSTIAKVLKRGLVQEGKVIKKAEVIVYE